MFGYKPTYKDLRRIKPYFSTDAKKFDIVQLPLLIKTLKKMGVGGYFLDIIKYIHLNPEANTRDTPVGVRNQEGCLPFA